MEVRK